MRRVLLLLLSLFLASGTVAGSIAHAAEDCARPVPASEMRDWDGCIETIVETDEESPAGDRESPSTLHGCHGHHSGMSADFSAAAVQVAHRMTHMRAPAMVLPPAAFAGTFRPPIA